MTIINYTSASNFRRKNRATNSFLRLDMAIDSLRICHVLQHDLAYLQRSFSESDLQNFDVPSLIPRHERQFIVQQFKRTKKAVYLLFNPLKVPILDGQKSLRKQDLKLFYKKILRVVYADQRADHVAWLVRSEFCGGREKRQSEPMDMIG